MDKLVMFQARFGKIDESGWWDLEIISAYAGTKFTSTEFQEEYQTRGVWLTLAATEHQEMNRQVKLKWRTLRMIAHSLMVHSRVLEAYINFTLMYTVEHIFLVLPIKDLINEDGEPTTPSNLATGTNLQYRIYMFYFVHVLYKKLLHLLGQRRQTCVTKRKRVFEVSLLEFQGSKRVSCLHTTKM